MAEAHKIDTTLASGVLDGTFLDELRAQNMLEGMTKDEILKRSEDCIVFLDKFKVAVKNMKKAGADVFGRRFIHG